jgi:hypothetical protein
MNLLKLVVVQEISYLFQNSQIIAMGKILHHSSTKKIHEIDELLTHLLKAESTKELTS